MIKFFCKKCNHLINVNEKYSGKQGKCPKCESIIIVPEKSTIVEVSCGNCGHKIKVAHSYSGKKGVCPKCKNPVVVPAYENTKVEGADTVSVTCSICGNTMQIAGDSTEEFMECSECASYFGTSPKGIPKARKELEIPSPPKIDKDLYDEDSVTSEDSEGIDRRLIYIISGLITTIMAVVVIWMYIAKFGYIDVLIYGIPLVIITVIIISRWILHSTCPKCSKRWAMHFEGDKYRAGGVWGFLGGQCRLEKCDSCGYEREIKVHTSGGSG